MSDTNINAYFLEVDEALNKVLSAQAEYEAAKTRLEDKKKEVGFEEPKADNSQSENKTTLFSKKK